MRLDVFNDVPADTRVELGHPPSFRECHALAVLQLHAVVVHAGYHRRGFVGNARDDTGVRLLAVHIEDVELSAEVAEQGTENTAHVAANKRGARVSARRVDLHGGVVIGLRAHHHSVLGAQLNSHRFGHDKHLHRGVELGKPRSARLRAVLADIALGQVELRAKIGELARAAVLQRHGFDTRQNHVLGCCL